MKKVLRLVRIELRPNRQVGLALMDDVPDTEHVDHGEEFARQIRAQLGDRLPKEAVESMKIFVNSAQSQVYQANYYNPQHYLVLTEREFKDLGSPQIGSELTVEMKVS